jgi:hypothetical protein
MLSKFFGRAKVNTPYSYRNNPEDLGQGTRALGFQHPNTSIVYDAYAGGLPTHRNLNASQPPQQWAPAGVVNVSLRGNGVGLSDALVWQALVNYNKENGGGAS